MDFYWTSDEDYSDSEPPSPSEILIKHGSAEKRDQLLRLYGKISVPGSVPTEDPYYNQPKSDSTKVPKFDFSEVDSFVYSCNNSAPEIYNIAGLNYISDGLRFKCVEDTSNYSESKEICLKPPKEAKPRLIRLNWAVKDEDPVIEIPKEELLIEYPFELDDFQKRAIYHVSRGKNVFVAAHTSAGKTVVAEYAISMALSKGRKAVYTSPIKALSNQKYREFKNIFNSVGIITGDVCCNPSASVMVMTTEILRNLLYRGDSLIGELDVVIFDEIHYISDLSRGVVWEEVIIMLPKVIQVLMLSATVSNYMEFSDWIGCTMQREVVAILTKKRPTPLVHYLHIHARNFLLMNSLGFNQQAYHQMYSYAKTLANKTKGKVQKPKSITPEGEIQKLQALIKYLEKTDKIPVILFSFSRAKCETYAKCMPKLDFNKTQIERSKVHLFIKESLESLSDADKQIPQLSFIVSLLERGVGVHHSGLLPIIKEMVEILFSKGLVKVLFATETFAMGVNMPARSVIFTNIRKHDGITNRPLTSAEYTQMAGRAGRRGLDTEGNVFIFSADEPPDIQDLSSMMIGKSAPLKSRFRITYSMILQVMSRNQMSIEELMSKSFLERNRAKKMPVYKRDFHRRKKELESMGEITCLYGEPTVKQYMDLHLKSRELALPIVNALWNSKYGIIVPGRLIRLHSVLQISSYSTAVIVEVQGDTLTCLVALPSSSRVNSDSTTELLFSASLLDHRITYYLIGGVKNVNISAILNSFLADGVLNKEIQNFTLTKSTYDILELLALSLINCSHDQEEIIHLSGFKNIPLEVYDNFIALSDLNKKINNNKCHNCEKLEEHFEMSIFKENCVKEIEEISTCIKNESLESYPEMQSRVEVLKQLGFLDSNNVPTIKGRVATYITTTDEITLTEVLFENILRDLEPAECAAVLSAFISTDRCQDESPIPTMKLQQARDKMLQIHNKIYVVQKAMGIHSPVEEFELLCNFNLLFLTYQWACLLPFSDIMEMTSLQEGNIVRAIIRLDELCKKVEHVAILMQDDQLADKMQKTCACIHRDIVFASSLYLK